MRKDRIAADVRRLAAFHERAALIPPAPEIVRSAREWPADRVLLGSVDEAVMRPAPGSILVVRAQA